MLARSYTPLSSRVVGCSVLVLLAITMASEVDAAKLLRWKLAKGETIHVRFLQDMTMEASQLGKSSADMSMDMKWVVEGVRRDGTFQMKQSIERLQMKMNATGIDEINYDSAAEQEESDPVTKSLSDSINPLVGIEFTQNMSARGEILDVKLAPQDQAKLAKQPANSQLQQIFSKDGLKALLSQAATVLPKEVVQPGYQWRGTTETRSPMGNMHLDLFYTYKGTETRDGRPLERIDVQMTLQFGDEVKALGLNIDVKDQKNWGTMYFDAEAGRFVETVMNQNLVLETSLGKQKHEQKLETVLRMQFASSPQPTASQVGANGQPVRRNLPAKPVSQPAPAAK
jgi:hypothetical protein